jgi:hypothetical protein
MNNLKIIEIDEIIFHLKRKLLKNSPRLKMQKLNHIKIGWDAHSKKDGQNEWCFWNYDK